MQSDYRQALRALLRTPWLLVAYVLPLAAGIGACATAFAALSAAYLTPLPFHEPQQLVEIWSSTSPRTTSRADLLPRERLAGLLDVPPVSLSAAAGYAVVVDMLESGDVSSRMSAAIVTPAFFDVLARGPLLGSYDAEPDARAAVISEDVWRTTFAGARDVIGRSIRFGAQSFVIGAVSARAAGYPSRADLWIPEAAWSRSASPAWIGLARLRDDSRISVLRQELQARAHAELRQDSSRFAGMGIAAVPLEDVARGSIGRAIPLTAAAIAIVYLAVLLNLAHLLLVRVLTREHDSAVRTALGAGPWQLVRPIIAETTLISALALGTGLLLASWGVLLLPRLDPALAIASVDWRVLAFSVALGCVTTTALVFVPLSSLRLDMGGTLRPISLRRTGRQRAVRGVLVAAQVALAVALLAIVGVLMRAVDGIRDLDVGYDAAQLVLVRPDWSDNRWSDAAQRDELEAVLRQMLNVPGAETGALWRTRVVAWPPPAPDGQLSIAGSSQPISTREALWNYDEVTPSFFSTLDLRVVEGRAFDARDVRGALPVAIVTESAARAWWPGGSPLGRRLRLGDDASPEPWLTVVGVTRDVEPIIEFARAIAASGRPARRVFRPLAQSPDEAAPPWASRQCFYCSRMTMGVRAAGNARTLAARIRREIDRVAPALSGSVVVTALDEQMNAYGPAQFARSSRLLGAFGTVTLLIALLGIGVVVSDTVARRRHELGIRIALGAGVGRIVGPVIRDSLVTCAAGACVGVGVLVIAEPLIRRWVFLGGNATLLPGTATLDWSVIAPTSLSLLAVAAVCAAAVGYRATRIDPMVVLRQD